MDQYTINRSAYHWSQYGRFLKVKKITLDGLVPATATETDTGFTLPDNAITLDVLLKVRKGVAGKTMDIGTKGTSNDPDGFADGISLANTGIVRPQATLSGSPVIFNAGTRGALLQDAVNGTNADDRGAVLEKPCLTAGGDPVSFTPQADCDAFEGDILIVYIDPDA